METSKIISLIDPKSPVTEAYRTLRTNIQFSSFDEKIKTIVITSSGPGEGKTTTSTNLATVMAQGGHKTILIDCDQRKPKVHKVFEFSNQTGLSNLLIGETTFEEAVHKTKVENLDVLTSGIRPPNPSELLASAKMKNFINTLKEKYEYIILDTPPVLMVTDAQIIGQYADGCLLVVSSGEAHREAAMRAKELLTKVNAKILGIVLNKVDTSRRGYYYGYYYHAYYGNEGERVGKKLNKSLKKTISK